MIRHIEKDKSTQVNANLIGVQIADETVTKVTGITIDYKLRIIVSSDRLPGDAALAGDRVCMDPDEGCYYCTATESMEYEGSTYYKWKKFGDFGPYTDELWSLYSSPEEGEGNGLYEWDGSSMTYATDFFRFKNFNIADTYYAVDEYTVQRSGSGVNYAAITEDRIFIYDPNGESFGYITIDTDRVWNDLVFNYDEEDSSEGWYVWKCENNDFVTLFDLSYMEVFTETFPPAIGDSAEGSEGGEPMMSQTVKGIVEEEESVPVEPNCTLSYSVDAKTWTDWPENMTDKNNVISNIPRYMYLKFSQDVVVTVE